jgi:hypothetical protein
MITKSIPVLVIVLLSTGYARAGTWTTLDAPGAIHTCITGIDGSKLVGSYTDVSGDHGFLYNGTTWTTLDMPGAASTYIQNVDGSNFVGFYYDSSGYEHGFIYTIPEPATEYGIDPEAGFGAKQVEIPKRAWGTV